MPRAKFRHIFVTATLLAAAALIADQAALFPRLKTNASPGKQPEGHYLLPTSQLLHPWGEQTVITGRPVDMTFDSAKRVLAILNTRNIWLVDGSSGKLLKTIPGRATSYAGIAYRPGDRQLWASEATRNGPDSILVAQLSDVGLPEKVDHIDLKGHPLPVGIAFSADGKLAYVAFSRSNTLAVFDATTREIVREIPVGDAPFGVTVSDKIFVTNRGGRRPKPGDTTAPSSGTQIVTDPVTGSSVSGTLSIIDEKSFEVKNVSVGLSPSHLVLSPDRKLLAVSNGHSDSVSILDTETLARTDVKIPTYPDAAIGSQPIASAFTTNGEKLYVACGGNNSIAVLIHSGKNWTVSGEIPTGWFPTSILLAPDGSLRILNLKGIGNTDNKKGGFNSKQYEGWLSRMPAPAAPQIAAGTREVRAANSPVWDPADGVQNLSSLGIEHVFFIVKENRTYDQVLGDLGKGNGDPKFCMYGRDVTPNHHALAEQFVTLDNFYTGGAISFDGHQWLMQAFVSDYVERAFASSPRGYAWDMSDSLVVPPSGFFWQSSQRPLDIRIFGEFQLPARWNPATQISQDMNESDLRSWSEYWKLYREGNWRTAVGSRSGVPALAKYSSPSYPNSSTTIPDAIRAEEFIRELAEHEKSGKMANLNLITITNDHTNGTKPGSPTPRAMVAANDLAMGRMVEAISKSRFWPKSLILIVEDDAQDGVDHVDGHRTIALAASPFIRRGVVDSNYYSHLSMVRTIQDIFRIDPRTRYAKAARPMSTMFTATANNKPFEHLTPKQKMDEMNPPLKALNGRRLWAAQQSMEVDWSEPDEAPQDVLNRVLWWDAKGYNTPYPER